MIAALVRRSNPRGTALLLILALVMELFFLFALMPRFSDAMAGDATPDMALFRGYDASATAYSAMKAGGGLAAYRAIEILDIAFPLVYALAFSSLIALGLKIAGLAEGGLRFLLLAPLSAGAFDYAENILVFASIAVHPRPFSALAAAAETATALKSLCLALTGLACLAAVVIAILKWRRPRPVGTVLAPKPVGPYAQAVKVGGFLFVSGQLGMDPETGKLAEGARAQAERAMENLLAILEAERLGAGDIVKTTVFLTDLSAFPEVNEAYGSFFDQSFPARSAVQVAALPKGAAVEIEAIARRR